MLRGHARAKTQLESININLHHQLGLPTPSMGARIYSTTPSLAVADGIPSFTGTIRNAARVRTKGFPGVMVSTLDGTPAAPGQAETSAAWSNPGA